MEVEDTYAEAFDGYYSEILVTARNRKWLMAAVNSATGYATSGIGCGCEAGIDRILEPENTPDRRIGAELQFWVMCWNKDPIKKLESELIHRIGQCILTAPTTAVFNATDSKDKFSVGGKLGFFGDGYQKEEIRYGRTVMNIPRMMGEFLIEKEIGYGKGIMGGNLWFFCRDEDSALESAEKAVNAANNIKGVVTTFPAGICASGSKIGSKYKFLVASTNCKLCPPISKDVEDSLVPEGVNSISEIVINGVSEDAVRKAMLSGIEAAKGTNGIVKISAGNYSGKLGRHKIYLKRWID